MTLYPIHPAASIFPMMSSEEFAALKNDIQTHGQKTPGKVFKGQILDGRNRYKACEELGIEFDYWEIEEVKDFDPIQYVLTHNLYRRHLNESQRAVVAGKLATLKVGDNQHTTEGRQICAPSIEQAANMLKVSPRSVTTAKQVIDGGSKEVLQAVESGELPVSLAAKFVAAEPDKKEQTKVIKQGKDAVKESVKGRKPSSEKQEKPKPEGFSIVKSYYDSLDVCDRAAISEFCDVCVKQSGVKNFQTLLSVVSTWADK